MRVRQAPRRSYAVFPLRPCCPAMQAIYPLSSYFLPLHLGRCVTGFRVWVEGLKFGGSQTVTSVRRAKHSTAHQCRCTSLHVYAPLSPAIGADPARTQPASPSIVSISSLEHG